MNYGSCCLESKLSRFFSQSGQRQVVERDFFLGGGGGGARVDGP